MAVSVIAGAPGVGKTALAVHWAHRVRSRYADGDLYINMGGFGPGPRLEATQALDTFLRCLHVPPERIPADVEGRAALYRSLLNGKKVLVFIDNALTVNQVRPLLPASTDCLAIVTSRSALPGLVAREGAKRMVLDELSPEESLILLREVLGAERVDAEPDAAARITAHCAYLPLALRITAERITSDPYTRLAEIAVELADEQARLDALGIEDDELSDVRAAFTASYRTLDPDTARAFRLLGLHPGPEFGCAAAAQLVGATETVTRRTLERLVRAHLLQHTGTDRYRLHDLLRLFAGELAREEPTEAASAVRRVIDWYLHSVARAHKIILPGFHDVPLEAGEGSTAALSFTDVEHAMKWFEDERVNLTEAVRQARSGGHDDLAWRLPAVMYGFFELRCYWSEWRELHLMGVEAAEAAADTFGLACNYLGLGDANWLLGEADEARRCYELASAFGREAGDGWVEGFALRGLGVLLQETQRPGEATEVTERAIGVFRAAGEKRGEGMALLTQGNCYRQLGDAQRAVDGYRRAVTVFAEIGDRWSVAWGRCFLGQSLGEAGDWPEATERYQEALETFRAYGDQLNEARSLIGLGEAYQAQGEGPKAREHFDAATEILDTLDNAQSAELRERMERSG